MTREKSAKAQRAGEKDPTKLLQQVYEEKVQRASNSVFPEYRNDKSRLYHTRSQLPTTPRSFRTLQTRGPWKKP